MSWHDYGSDNSSQRGIKDWNGNDGGRTTVVKTTIVIDDEGFVCKMKYEL